METKIHVNIANLDKNDYNARLSNYLKKRFKGLLELKYIEDKTIILYAKLDYELELPIFFQKDKVSFYYHVWKIDAYDMSGFGAFLLHLIRAWTYNEYKLEKPNPSDLNLNHSRYKNYKSWRKGVLKNRSFFYKISAMMNNTVPKELFYI
jgi:hypothetical protein